MKLTNEQIATAIKCPVASVTSNWPRILQCLEALGIGDDLTQVAALATIAVETGFTFKPIKEFDNKDHTYLKSKKYYPYFGRGYVQITWDYNYKAYGKLLGIDLVNNPDLALQPDVAAFILAAYFRDKHIDKAAAASDWRRVRTVVNGGLNGFVEFKGCVDRLLSAMNGV